jgi:hypothetical protein
VSKFNRPSARPASGMGFIASETVSSGRTFQGAPGYKRDSRSELFLLAVTNMVGEPTFYESEQGRDSRFVQLIHEVAVADPHWTGEFLKWLRGPANMRSASLVGAMEAVRAMTTASPKVRGGRYIVNAVLQRPDEPGEALSYWASRYSVTEIEMIDGVETPVTHLRLPKPIKRGIADAAVRLYNERSLLKYDTASHDYRFGDVIDLVHPVPGAGWQTDLFRWAIERRHGRDTQIPNGLDVLEFNAQLRRIVGEGNYTPLSDPEMLRSAGMTWEDALSLAGSKVNKAALWEAMIPSMGYMALLRNLRNFDEAGVSDRVAATVVARLADPAEVAASRQFPMRFLAANRAVPSQRWGHALDQALTASLANVPVLSGRTLVLVDTSSSMNASFSKDGTVHRWDAAAVFGIALGQRCATADVVSFSSNQFYYHDTPGPKTKVFPARRGESLLRSVERWKSDGFFLGGGTDTSGALRKHFAGHDRVVILTDEQAAHDGAEVGQSIPATTPLYTFNLAGYQMGHAADGRYRTTLGGLTDAGFRLIPLLEAGYNAAWPWQK